MIRNTLIAVAILSTALLVQGETKLAKSAKSDGYIHVVQVHND